MHDGLRSRSMSLAAAPAGAQAKAHGLVDELGGLARAIELAKQQAGLPLEEEAVEVVEYPPRQRASGLVRMLAR